VILHEPLGELAKIGTFELFVALDNFAEPVCREVTVGQLIKKVLNYSPQIGDGGINSRGIHMSGL